MQLYASPQNEAPETHPREEPRQLPLGRHETTSFSAEQKGALEQL